MPDAATIRSVHADLFRVPLPEPMLDSRRGAYTHFELVTVRVRADDGAEGVGHTYTGGTGGRAIHQVLAWDLAPALAGRPADDIDALWDFMDWHVHYVGRGGVAGFAVSAVDIALWDLRAKRAGEPLWRLLDGEGEPVKTYAGLIDLHYAIGRHKEVVSAALARGHTGVKIKLGRPTLDEDLARARAIRNLVGPDVKLMVDASMQWDAGVAVQAARRLADLDVVWLEGPVPADDFDAFERVGRQSDVPLAAGAHLHTMSEFMRAFATEYLDFPQADASSCGGVTGWMKVADMAAGLGLPVCSHGMQELHVSLLSAVPHAGYMEMHGFNTDAYTTRPLTVTGGRVTPPESPGTGVELDWDKLAPFRVKMPEPA